MNLSAATLSAMNRLSVTSKFDKLDGLEGLDRLAPQLR